MNKYAQALGIITIEVGEVSWAIKPVKGDNLRLSEIRRQGSKNPSKLANDFVTYFCDLVAREEKIEKDSDTYKDLELFVEFHLDEIQEKVLVAFGWITEEELKAAEAKALEGFQKQLNT